jgi:hypothetical protein
MPKRWAKAGWQQWQLDLLGTAPDAELATRFGRTVAASKAEPATFQHESQPTSVGLMQTVMCTCGISAPDEGRIERS